MRKIIYKILFYWYRRTRPNCWLESNYSCEEYPNPPFKRGRIIHELGKAYTVVWYYKRRAPQDWSRNHDMWFYLSVAW